MRRIGAVALAVALTVGTGGAVAGAGATSTLTDQAAAEDATLLQSAPTTSGETTAATPPSRILKSAPSEPVEDNLVVQALYWSANRSAGKVYSALTASPPAGFTSSGYGSVSGATIKDDVSYINYDPDPLPSNIAFGELQVAVAPLSSTTSAIGVFAEAVAQPPRPAAEDLPAEVGKVQATWVVGIDALKPLRRTVPAPQAQALAKAFNALKVDPPGESGCGLDLGQSQGAVFHAAGHIWTASVDACYGVAVTKDGSSLPWLDDSTRFYEALQRALGVGKPPRPKTTRVPAGTKTMHLTKVNEPSGVAGRSISVAAGRAGALLGDINGMLEARIGIYHCQSSAGRHTVAAFTARGHHWRLNEAPCHTIVITEDGHRFVSLVSADLWEQEIHSLFNRGRAAAVTTRRPPTEHVPYSLNRVRLTHRTSPFDTSPQTATVHGKRAHRLVTIFDGLGVESRSAVHCDIAGGPETTATFRTRKHTWVAVESACSDLRVTLDGSRLPTLVPTSAWDKATAADLRR